ncbi:unnamed protein product [Debaryomyces tyrocola]|nr:unnamed protein product [Debaryomyces tyrocola]
MLGVIAFAFMLVEIEMLWAVDGSCFFREYNETDDDDDGKCELIGTLTIKHTLFSSKKFSRSVINTLGLIQDILNFYFVGFFNNITLYPIEKYFLPRI